MASTLMKTMGAKKHKNKSKSTKDKTRNIQASFPEHSISNPATIIVKQAGEGLYIKLTQHQRNIAGEFRYVITALENGTVKYQSRHNKTNLTTVVTNLLVQLDCAVTTAHQCFTKDVFDRNDFKPRLEDNEKKMFAQMAFLVRWLDSKGEFGREYHQDKERISSSIQAFELALAEVVRLVYETQMASSSGSQTLPTRQRRSSLDSNMIQGAQKQLSLDESLNQTLTTPKQEGKIRDRKISWSPGMGPSYGNILNTKTTSLKPGMLRDSLLSAYSEGSSTSDEDKRRSGSSERYQHSPEHVHVKLHVTQSLVGSDSRQRSMTTPYDVGYSSVLPLPIPVPTPIAPSSAVLPPLPGETLDEAAPPLPKRGEDFAGGEGHPPLPPRKAHTLPRESAGQHVNGKLSPDGLQYTSENSNESTPPPLPMKKRHMSVQVNGHGTNKTHPSDGDTVPPPLPVKQRRATKASIGSPSHPPTQTPTHTAKQTATHITAESMMYPAETPGKKQSFGLLPPVPMRMESIPWVKSALVVESPPPKPPRTDRPFNEVHGSPHHVAQPRPSIAGTPQQLDAINAIRKYNEDIMKAKESGNDVAPPVPLKKKTVMMYKELLQGYTYDESLMQPLHIPGMEAPPPLPPKKRARRKQTANISAPVNRSQQEEGAIIHRRENSELSASNEDVYSEDAEEGGEVNYLECEEASGYLTFNREEDGSYTLRGGPVEALIAYAASSTRAVKHFSEAFLLTYYTFITPDELISKLLYRLGFFYKSKIAAVWQSTTSLLVRVLTGLSKPMAKEAQLQLIDMVHQMITDGNLKFAQLLRNALVEKLNQLLPSSVNHITLGVAMQSKSGRKVTVMDYQPDEIAKQMTILDNELFQKVDVCEMLYWAAEQSEEKSPMLTHFTMHFNNVSRWTQVILLKRGIDMRARCKIMVHFISIMKCLRDNHNNFNSYLAILSAIESSPLSRLDWPDKILKSLEEPRQLIDNRGSFKNYREAFARAKPPCIPYIGLYLQDLTFIQMQPSKLENDQLSINFTKRWNQFKSVDHIRFAQTKQYTYDPDPDIMSLFGNFEVDISDEELWAISHEIKPSARAQRTHQS